MNSCLARNVAWVALISVLAILATPVAAKDKANSPKTERAYIETSYLIAPRKVGAFTLEKASYNPDNKYAGAGFRYVAEGHQETRIDVYVYPAGRMSREQALQRGLQMFEQDMALATEGGAYANVVVEPAIDFVLEDAPQAESEKVPATTDLDAKIIAALADVERLQGNKMSLTLDIKPQNWPMYSSMHLFYKQLYFFKVRASAAQSRIAIADFNALVDTAARTLIPAIEAAHVGGCAGGNITLDKDADAEEMAIALVTQGAVLQGYNCHLSAKDAEIKRKSADAEVVEIAYQASEWKAE